MHFRLPGHVDASGWGDTSNQTHRRASLPTCALVSSVCLMVRVQATMIFFFALRITNSYCITYSRASLQIMAKAVCLPSSLSLSSPCPILFFSLSCTCQHALHKALAPGPAQLLFSDNHMGDPYLAHIFQRLCKAGLCALPVLVLAEKRYTSTGVKLKASQIRLEHVA